MSMSAGGEAARPAAAAWPQGKSDEVAIALAHDCAKQAAALAGREVHELQLPAIIGCRAARLLEATSVDVLPPLRRSPSNGLQHTSLPRVAAALEAGAAELLRMSEVGLLGPAAALHSGLVLAASAQMVSLCVHGAAASGAASAAKPVARLPGAADSDAAGEAGALARAAAAAAEAASIGLLCRQDSAGATMVAELAAADALAAASLLQLACLVRPTHGAPGAGWLRASERGEPWKTGPAEGPVDEAGAALAASAATVDSEQLCRRIEASAYGEGGKPGSRAAGAFEGVRTAGRLARPGERAAALLAAEVASGIGATLATELCQASRSEPLGGPRAGDEGRRGAEDGGAFWGVKQEVEEGESGRRGGGAAAAAASVASLLLAGVGPAAACSPLVGVGLACLPASLARLAPEEALAWWPPGTVLALLESAAAGSAAMQACAPVALETPVARAGVGAAGVWARVLEATLFHAERATAPSARGESSPTPWEVSAVQLTRCVAAASAARVLDDARLRLDAAAAALGPQQQRTSFPPAAGPEAAVSLIRLSHLAAERRGQSTALPVGGWLPWAVLRGSSAACSDRLAVTAVAASAALATAVREALAASGTHLPPLRASRGAGGPVDALEILAPPTRGWREQLLGRHAGRRGGQPVPPPDRADLPVAAAPSAVRLVPATEAGAAASAARRRVQRRLGLQRRDAPFLHGEVLAVSPGPVSGSFSVLERLDGARPPLAADGSPVLSVAAVDGGAPDSAIDECVSLAIEAEATPAGTSASATGSALLWLAEPPPRPAGELQEDSLEEFFAADDAAACLVMDEEEVDVMRTYAMEQRRTGQGTAVRTVLRLSEATASLTAAGGGILPWEPLWAGDDAAARGAWEDAPSEGDAEGWAHVTQALVDAASQRSGGRGRTGAASGVSPAEHAEAGPMSALAAAALLATARCRGAEEAASFAWCVWPADAEPPGEGDAETAAAVMAALARGFGTCMPPSLRHVAADASVAVLQALAGSASRSFGAEKAARNFGHVSVGGPTGAAIGALLAGTAEPYGMLQAAPQGLGGRAWFSKHARAVALPAQECVAVLREAAAGGATAAASVEEDEAGAALTPGRTGPMGMYAPLGFPLLRLQHQLSRVRAEGACSLRRAAWLELAGLAEVDTEAALDAAVLLVHALHSAVCEPVAEVDGARCEGLLAEARGCLAALAAMARGPAVDMGAMRSAAEAGPGARADIARRVLRLREERQTAAG